MRTTAMLAGLALVLGLTVPVPVVAAEPAALVPAADGGMGAGGGSSRDAGPGAARRVAEGRRALP